MNISSVLLSALVCWSPAVPVPVRQEAAELTSPVLARIVVAGASLSSGYGLDRELGSKTTFAELLDEAIQVEHGAIVGVAQPFFFADPEGYGRLMIDDVLEREPTLVIAVDFPFWFGYGSMPESERAARMKYGLSLLGELECPVVVGNLPNMKAAAGGVLSVIQIPEVETLGALNQQLRAWADERPNRLLVDLATYMEHIREKRDLSVGGGWEGQRAGELLQADQLHPSLIGSALIALMTVELIGERLEGVEPRAFETEVEALVARVKAKHRKPPVTPSEN